MVRISWPLAILVAAVIAIVARRPQLLVPMLVVFAIWYVVQATSSRGRRR
jgi:F0F1-type ATP synthase membrane subunit c/vacuolar-type H+-ATPase subunit K